MEMYKYYCDQRIGENVSCKILRIESGSDKLFSDYYFEGQNLFYAEDGTLYIISQN